VAAEIKEEAQLFFGSQIQNTNTFFFVSFICCGNVGGRTHDLFKISRCLSGMTDRKIRKDKAIL
jgi:hypothetical protein